MEIMKLDSKRRVVLPKAAVELGEEFVAIEIKKEGILLKPLPKDPIREMQKEGEKLKGLSRHKLRKEIYKQALKEVE